MIDLDSSFFSPFYSPSFNPFFPPIYKDLFPFFPSLLIFSHSFPPHFSCHFLKQCLPWCSELIFPEIWLCAWPRGCELPAPLNGWRRAQCHVLCICIPIRRHSAAELNFLPYLVKTLTKELSELLQKQQEQSVLKVRRGSLWVGLIGTCLLLSCFRKLKRLCVFWSAPLPIFPETFLTSDLQHYLKILLGTALPPLIFHRWDTNQSLTYLILLCLFF